MELRMYKFRIYPSHKQKDRIITFFKTCKVIYNELLDLSKKTYKDTGKTLRKFDFDKTLKGRYPEVHSQVKQNVSDRVHKAFDNFFRRVKDPSCKEKGYPRFKSRVQSITFPQSGFKLLSNKRLKLNRIGNVPIVLHRVPKGKIKTLTIKQNRACQWFAVFSCEIEMPAVKHPNKDVVGIDVGIESLAVISDGEIITNPRFLAKSESRLKLLHRRVSRKKKGSANRRKARFRLSRLYNKITNQRDDFAHKLSRKLTTTYGTIKIEDLSIQNMLKNHALAKHISDVSWNRLFQFMSYKAVECGGYVIKVNPRNTSKQCSNCGNLVDMKLSDREFCCPDCRFVAHRDFNASINILKVGQDLPELNACGHGVRPLLAKAVVVESGTTYGK